MRKKLQLRKVQISLLSRVENRTASFKTGIFLRMFEFNGKNHWIIMDTES